MRVLLYVCMACLVMLTTLEVGARILVPSNVDNPRYLAISQGFEKLPQLLRDKRSGGGERHGTKYYEYEIYSNRPHVTETMTFTDYHSARLTPASVPRQEAGTIIWTFGGSTMQNAETSDELSIANAIAKVFISNGMKARVENFGVGAFQSSLELVKFSTLLARVPPAERPKVAIFYDGFNDAYYGYSSGAGTMQPDLSRKMAALVEGQSAKLAVYAASNWLSDYSKFWQSYVHNRIQSKLFSRLRYVWATTISNAPS
jgi:hypothetical protein